MEKALRASAGCGKIIPVRNGWAVCPACKRNFRLAKVLPETEGTAVVWYCRDCKTEIIVDIAKGQSVERRSR